MAIEKKLIHFKKLASFKKQLEEGNILGTSIVFIQDANLIWTHGTYYGVNDGSNVAISSGYSEVTYPEVSEEVTFNSVQADDSLDAAVSKIEQNVSTLAQEVIDNEKITANALNKLNDSVEDLNDSLSDISLSLDESYVAVSYPETGDVEFTPAVSGDSFDTAIGKIDQNVSTLAQEVIDNEKNCTDSINELSDSIEDLRDSLSNISLSLGDEYESVSYPEIETVEFNPAAAGDTLETAIGKVDQNVSNLAQNVLDNEEVVATALTELNNAVLDLQGSLSNISHSLGDDYVAVVYPELNEEVEFIPAEAGDTLDVAVGKIDQNVSTLVQEVLENEQVIAATLALAINSKLSKEDANGAEIYLSGSYSGVGSLPEGYAVSNAGDSLDTAIANSEKNLATVINSISSIPTVLSETPVLQRETLGGVNIYERVFEVDYTTPGELVEWSIPCTKETYGVKVLGLEGFITQFFGENNDNMISFDYKDHYLFGENMNVVRYYFSHSTGSAVLQFKSEVASTFRGVIKFSSATAVSEDDSMVVVK